jgi:Protein of unknown function (DUF3179)
MKIRLFIVFLFISVCMFQVQSQSFPGFSTDWSRTSINTDEIRSGGPAKDGIPALNNPLFVPAFEADTWLSDKEAIILLQEGTVFKAYPLQIMAWHEIVNDIIADTPVSITWCPLCNTTVVFKRDLDGRILDFGTTGHLRFSNMLMYDRQTESWWQQAEGKAVIGNYMGVQLDLYPSRLLPWREIRDIPGLMVLSQETGYDRPYGRNPYEGYDDPDASPFLLDRIRRKLIDDSENALLDRVILVPGENKILISYKQLRQNPVFNSETAFIFWSAGTASALDKGRVGGGRDVGTANAFYPFANSQRLTFELHDKGFRDIQTGTIWNSLGIGIEGPHKGVQLKVLPSLQHFWFSVSLMEY